MEVLILNERQIKVSQCQGCLEEQPNQLAHYGGCLPDLLSGETWEDFEIACGLLTEYK